MVIELEDCSSGSGSPEVLPRRELILSFAEKRDKRENRENRYRERESRERIWRARERESKR